MVEDNMSSFAQDFSRKKAYLIRATRLPFLPHTLVTYLFQAHVYSGSIDGNIYSIRISFTIITLLYPHTFNFDKYTSILNSSRNTEVECLLDHPSERRSGIKIEVFIKGRQETLDNVPTFVSNVLVFGCFWVLMNIDDITSSIFVIQLRAELLDVISSAEYQEFVGGSL